MILNRSSNIRSLISRAVNLKESLKINSGALYIITSRGMADNPIGSGVGKGGGGGGSIREAGGAMGKKGAAQEEQYFSKQNAEMKEKLKQHLEEEIKKHEDAIKANKELMKEIGK